MEQKWLTIKIEYEGFPLYLRKPEYQEIFAYRDKLPNVLRVTQKLKEVNSNGLPESDYNMSLMDFDGQMCDLFNGTDDGLIFLIETFGGERSYYYFITASVDYDKLIQKIKTKNEDIDLETHSYADSEWGFLKNYPTKLY
jgi:hypothetical protein